MSDHELRKFLTIAARHTPGLDPDRAAKIIKHLSADQPAADADVAEIRQLERRWYDSVARGSPDFSVYADPYYFCDVWMCWSVYSRKYLRNICNPKSLETQSIVDAMVNVDRVLDLGCAFGYTTSMLKQIFPRAEVTGTNLPGTAQWRMAAEIAGLFDFKLLERSEKHHDLIFASEYFEHFENPIEHLFEVLSYNTPRYMLIANTFTSPAIGHFPEYKYDGETYSGKQMSRMFNATLCHFGYEKIRTKCWNNRPTFWQHK